MTTSDESFKKYLFDELSRKIEERNMPFVYIERNPQGMEWVLYTSDEDEFEAEDLENIKTALVECLRDVEEELQKIYAKFV